MYAKMHNCKVTINSTQIFPLGLCKFQPKMRLTRDAVLLVVEETEFAIFHAD